MAKRIENRPIKLTLVQQVFGMRKFPQMRASVSRQRYAIWEGLWQPSDMSATYRLRITYELGCRPKINVVTPQLELAPGKLKLPHTYGDQHDICVHRPEEWNPGLLIADWLMPWISQWLYFYEIWFITGKWIGGGTHPSLPEHAC